MDSAVLQLERNGEEVMVFLLLRSAKPEITGDLSLWTLARFYNVMESFPYSLLVSCSMNTI